MTSQVPNVNSSVIVDSRITDVTVYSDQAKITRKGQISLTGQEREFTVTKLPILLQKSSIRVAGQGSAAVQILGVRMEHIVATEPVTERIAALTQQIEGLKEQKAILNSQSEAIKSQLNFIQNLSENIDEGLTLERDLIEREVDRKLMGGKRRILYGYRLNITNLKDIPVHLILQEQLPVSRDERIKVRLNQTYPKIALGEMGLLEWILSLKPQEKQEITYQFVVEHPPELTVSGLNI